QHQHTFGNQAIHSLAHGLRTCAKLGSAAAQCQLGFRQPFAAENPLAQTGIDEMVEGSIPGSDFAGLLRLGGFPRWRFSYQGSSLRPACLLRATVVASNLNAKRQYSVFI